MTIVLSRFETAPTVNPRTRDILIRDIRTFGLTPREAIGHLTGAAERYPNHEVSIDGDRYTILARPGGVRTGCSVFAYVGFISRR